MLRFGGQTPQHTSNTHGPACPMREKRPGLLSSNVTPMDGWRKRTEHRLASKEPGGGAPPPQHAKERIDERHTHHKYQFVTLPSGPAQARFHGSNDCGPRAQEVFRSLLQLCTRQSLPALHHLKAAPNRPFWGWPPQLPSHKGPPGRCPFGAQPRNARAN